MSGGRDNPWGAPPKSRAWRRLASLVLPLAVGAACRHEIPGTSTTPDTSEELSPPGTMAVPTGETADTGTP